MLSFSLRVLRLLETVCSAHTLKAREMCYIREPLAPFLRQKLAVAVR